jgi:hydrogenase nickel incorporation protein HypA/HybF
MHEFSIMESALQVAAETARNAQAKRVHAVRMRIGTLSGAVPEALEFAFEALAPGTLVEGARLEITSVPARFWCANCQNEFEAENLLSQCPVCLSPSADLRSGRELEVASLEID